MYIAPIKIALKDYPAIERIVRRAASSYKGRKFYVKEQSAPMNINSYWDGGSRDYFALVRLSDNAILPIPTSHPHYDKPLPGAGMYEPREGFALVENSCSCGKWIGVTVYFHPADMPRQLTVIA